MRSFPEFGVWTCAGLYLAIGVFGILFFSARPDAIRSSDGYGIIHIAAGADRR